MQCPVCQRDFNYMIRALSSSKFEKYFPKSEQPVIAPERRTVYTHHLRCLPLTASIDRNISPDLFRRPNLISIVKPWLQRELQAITETSNVTTIVALVLSNLCKFRIRDPQFSEPLRQFIYDNVTIFCHELEWFVRSGLPMTEYDLQVQYILPDATPTPENVTTGVIDVDKEDNGGDVAESSTSAGHKLDPIVVDDASDHESDSDVEINELSDSDSDSTRNTEQYNNILGSDDAIEVEDDDEDSEESSDA